MSRFETIFDCYGEGVSISLVDLIIVGGEVVYHDFTCVEDGVMIINLSDEAKVG